MTPTTKTTTLLGSVEANWDPAVSTRWITSIDAPCTVSPMEKIVSVGGKVVVVDIEVVVLVVVVTSAITGVVVLINGVASSPEQATNDNVAIDVLSNAWRLFMF